MLSAQAKRGLVVALGYRTKLANEFETALFSKQPISAALKLNIIDAMARRPEALEIINCLETSGSVPLSVKARKRFLVMLGGRGNLDTAAAIAEILPLMLGAPAPVVSISLINLLMGVSKNFAVLGASTVTNTGSTVVTGDLGLYAGTSVTGFPPGTVTGTKHITDAAAQQAQLDLSAAYLYLASLAGATDLSGQDLGGMTLAPGVYKFTSSAQLTGILTLDAAGDANARWVFQIGTTLTTATSSSVVLINSADVDNVCFQVGSSATLGGATAFIGNILAHSSITMVTSATIDGRTLAQIGAVTLDTNTVTI